jgi:hypothetical protein
VFQSCATNVHGEGRTLRAAAEICANARRDPPTRAAAGQKLWISDESKSLSAQLLLWGRRVAQIVCLERAARVRAYELGRDEFSHVEAGCDAAFTE